MIHARVLREVDETEDVPYRLIGKRYKVMVRVSLVTSRASVCLKWKWRFYVIISMSNIYNFKMYTTVTIHLFYCRWVIHAWKNMMPSVYTNGQGRSLNWPPTVRKIWKFKNRAEIHYQFDLRLFHAATHFFGKFYRNQSILNRHFPGNFYLCEKLWR